MGNVNEPPGEAQPDPSSAYPFRFTPGWPVPPAGYGHCHRLHLLRLVRGMYGQVAFHGKAGTVTLAFERGTVQSASGGHLVLRAADGTTWTWDLTSNSVVREHGKTVPSSALSDGSRVFAAGQATGATRNARLVSISKAKVTGSAVPSGAPSA